MLPLSSASLSGQVLEESHDQPARLLGNLVIAGVWNPRHRRSALRGKERRTRLALRRPGVAVGGAPIQLLEALHELLVFLESTFLHPAPDQARLGLQALELRAADRAEGR